MATTEIQNAQGDSPSMICGIANNSASNERTAPTPIAEMKPTQISDRGENVPQTIVSAASSACDSLEDSSAETDGEIEA